ncbi:MAG: response regulator, partial [Acidobacteria bacterium]|nr:response regulator [Acidobacteriota bacterium]
MAKTILLADDSVMIQKVIELTFIGEDYGVHSVSSGDEALTELEGGAPDVVIADVHMHGSASGYQVARRSKELYPHVPVLLLVGSFEPFDQNEYQSCGADRYLKKPFESEELERLVEELLTASAAEEQAEELAPELPTAVAPDAFAPTAVSIDPVDWSGSGGDDVPSEDVVELEDDGPSGLSLDLSDLESEPTPASQVQDFRLDLDEDEEPAVALSFDTSAEDGPAVEVTEEVSYGEVQFEVEDTDEPPLELAESDDGTEDLGAPAAAFDDQDEPASAYEAVAEEPVAVGRLSDEDV